MDAHARAYTHTHTHACMHMCAHTQGTNTNVSVLSQELNSLNITPAVESAIAERITSDDTIIGLNFSAVLMDFEPYTDCQTTIERQCSISSFVSLCETVQLRYINVRTLQLWYT